MNRRGFLLVTACGVAQGFQQKKDETVDPDRKADIYAIYSLMMTNPTTSHGPGGNDILLIRNKTVRGTPRVPCVGPPPSSPYERDFAEVLADYNLRMDEGPVALGYALNIPKNYLLLNETECGEFMKTRELPPTREIPERFRFSKDLFGLTDVFFNRRRTLALTGFSTWCGLLCGGYFWMVFEKTNAGWQQLPWQACRVIA